MNVYNILPEHSMKKTVAIFLIILLASSLFALEVSRSELDSATNPDVIQFINYTGPYTVINTKAQIAAIGTELGQIIASKESLTAGTENRYHVLHAIDDSDGGLDADILTLGPGVGVDHIRNLRTIITGYLTAAYNYSEADASTLATFITVYNAVYRGKFDEVKGKYKQIVLDNLSSDIFGLSVNFEDWPGKTQIVIPLHDPDREGLSIIDTTSITDSNVIDSMREEDSRGVDERTNMADFKEREAEEAYEIAQEAQKDAVAAQKAAEDAKAAAEDAKAARIKAEEEAALAREAAIANPDDEEAFREALDKDIAARKAAEEEEARKKEALDAEALSKAKSEEAAKEQKFSDRKRTETLSERSDIAADKKKNLDEERAAADIQTIWGQKLVDKKNGYSQIVYIDSQSGDVVRESPVTLIRNRTIIQIGDTFAAIAGKKGLANSSIKLVLIDKESLEICAQSVEDVSEEAAFVYQDGFLWTVVAQDKNYVVAKYSEDLRLAAKSDVAVIESTPIDVSEAGVIVTAKDGSAILLSKDTLNSISAD